MTTLIIKIPDGKKSLSDQFFKKHKLKTTVLKTKEDEDLIAKWIDHGLKTDEVSETEIFETLRKNGIAL